MNNISFNLFKGGVSHCLTMSYDDGKREDIRLAEIFRKNGIKGTFHLNSAFMSDGVNCDEVVEVYSGHEVSCHMATHPIPTQIPDEAVVRETVDDKRALEAACGYPIRGMSYPFGDYNSHVIDIIRTLGIEYSRTTRATNGFFIPSDFLEWHPTCHHNDNIAEKFTEFIKNEHYPRHKLFYVWGHSYEFRHYNNWEIIENFCKVAGGRDDIWYATNIEIVDYINATRALRFTTELDKVYNPSAIDVWFTVNGDAGCAPAGKTVSL